MTSGAPPSRERSGTADWVRALQRTQAIAPASTRTLAAVVAERAAAHPDRPALIGACDGLDYAALAARIDRVTRFARREGLRAGDTVALMMGNAPDYAAIWIGLSRAGIVTALLNTQLVGEGLAHCLSLAAPRLAIVGVSHRDRLERAALGLRILVHGADPTDERSLERAMADPAMTDLDPDAPVAFAEVALADPALLIYTSGTTGLPKAAHVSHYRIMMWCEWFAGLMDAGPEDRLYDCLPMYHSIGGVVAVGAMLVAGGAVIVRDGFSASRFWPDVVASRATIFQYIGELCRYLMDAPAEAARGHSLRLACGNGLRPDVWERFEQRFAIPRIVEFYAATEGSFSLFNLEGRVGAIGRIPRFMAHRSPVALVRFDPETERPARGPDGFCQRCDNGEPGEAIGRVAGRSGDLATRFEGYTSEADNDAKILRDVFAAGDRWFRTGDLMRQDAQGFFYFLDRIGDTFRWKGENVATAEVADALGRCPGVREATVYGVEVPGAEGRVGMAALAVAPAFDIEALARHLAARLPAYARPIFLRLRDTLDVTTTFKLRKGDLVRDGFDPHATTDRLFVLSEGRFRVLDRDMHARIVAGEMRL